MNQKKKKQHYVPRFYLKSFARQKKPEEFIIRSFNKETGAKFEQNITQVAMEKYFYDDGNPPDLENYFSRLESLHAKVYNKIIKYQSIEQLTMYDKFTMCHFILIQNERTRSARIRNAQLVELIYKFLEEEKNFPKFESFTEEQRKLLLESRAAMGQINIMFYPVEMGDGTIHYPFDIVFEMSNLGWILLKNNLKREFYTSDHPIYVCNAPIEGKMVIRGYGGKSYTAEGVEIFLPLSPRLCLVLFDKKKSDYRHFGLSKYIIQDELDWINRQIIAISHRTVFTKNNDFQFVRECIEEYKELKDPNRMRL